MCGIHLPLTTFNNFIHTDIRLVGGLLSDLALTSTRATFSILSDSQATSANTTEQDSTTNLQAAKGYAEALVIFSASKET